MLHMSKKLRILVAQLNPVVGDIGGNLELARGALAEGGAGGGYRFAWTHPTGLRSS